MYSILYLVSFILIAADPLHGTCPVRVMPYLVIFWIFWIKAVKRNHVDNSRYELKSRESQWNCDISSFLKQNSSSLSCEQLHQKTYLVKVRKSISWKLGKNKAFIHPYFKWTYKNIFNGQLWALPRVGVKSNEICSSIYQNKFKQ